MKSKRKNLRTLIGDSHPARLILVSYIISILIGCFFLILPISSSAGNWTRPIDALFTSTSAMCVTGLTPVNTASYWSMFGQIVLIILVQIGGIGIMTANALIGLILGKKFTMKNRMEFVEEINSNTSRGIVALMKFVIFSTLTVEAVGAAILAIQFIPEFGFARGLYCSIFHSVSAFCNAGLDILGDSSLSPYINNELISYTISILIVIGGTGYGVGMDLFRKRNWCSLKLHSKVMLKATAIIIFIPTIIIMILEYNNPNTIGNLGLTDKFTASFFQSVTPRTAGFYTIPQEDITSPTYILTLVLMLIGGGSQGTAGGLKITTVLILILAAVANVNGQKDISIGKRRIDDEIVRKAFAISVIMLLWTLCAVFLIIILEDDASMSDCLYEVVSAVCTVGLTRGITPDLCVLSKIILSITMLFGKLGGISMVYAFTDKKPSKLYKEAKGEILVG